MMIWNLDYTVVLGSRAALVTFQKAMAYYGRFYFRQFFNVSLPKRTSAKD